MDSNIVGTQNNEDQQNNTFKKPALRKTNLNTLRNNKCILYKVLI